ncbi:MAG TPA: GAF domain-containing protein, partial [Candidatus Limnocylindria bacterium]
EAIGAMGAFSSRPAAFSEAQIHLLRALADHAATAIVNQRLLGELATSADELARRVETQRTLHRISASITAIRDSDQVLQQVVDAAVRLLGSDGAHLTLRDPDEPILRPHVMAGGMDEETRSWLATQEFPMGGGINGLAAELNDVVCTADYLTDPRIPHTRDDQAVARRMGLRGMAAAPLRGPDGAVFGTLAISYKHPREIAEFDTELLQGLADAGAIAIQNARLYGELTESEARYRFLVENSPDLIWESDRQGNFTYLSETGLSLIGMPPEELIGQHFSAVIAPESLPIVMEHWQRAIEDPLRRQQYRFTALHSDGSHIPMEINAVGTVVDGEFQGAHGSVRDIRERVALENHLRSQAEELARVVEVQRTLGEIARRIVEVDDSGEILQQVVDASKHLLKTDGAHLTLMDENGTDLIPMVVAGDTNPETRAWLQRQRFPVGGGINGLAAAAGQPVWTDDYASDPRIPHNPADESPSRLELGAVAVAPLRGPGGDVIGTLAVTYRKPRPVDSRDVALLEELAGQGSIAARNARLYEQLRDSERRYRTLAEELSRLLEAQRSLSAIAVQISSIRDPAAVLQRTVDEAHRLLNADLALVNPLDSGSHELQWAVAHAPSHLPADDVVVTAGEGVSGTALAERRVVRTGDYLADPQFAHSPDLDAYVRRRGMASVMSAPLVVGDESIGALTVQAARTDAFTEDDARLLDALAAQAAVAIANARLLEQVGESERSYRHLVDHSPDLVWQVDADGRFTYLGESLERMTGFRPEQLLGEHFRALTAPESLPLAEAGWRAVQERPEEEQQIRIELPLAGGGVMPAEVNMVATLVDGRFAGAQGSIRDVRERERLETDLRRQAAALAANEERANLARELHDSVTQALFSMGLTARAIELLMDRDLEAARAKVRELRDLQKDALAEMRTLIFELRPQGLETDGLAQALRNHGAAVQGRTGLDVSVEVDSEERLPVGIEEALYRVAQEALHNVVKHANASRARIGLHRTGQAVKLVVEDDGIGFDPDAIARGHLGVVGMRQRAERIGADLVISPRPGGGTRVRLVLPLSSAQGAGAEAVAGGRSAE